MHVGHPGNIDIKYTVTRQRSVDELIEKLPSNSPELSYFKSDPNFHKAFPNGKFNCWGIPGRAEPRFLETNPGDLVLIIPHIGIHDGGIHQLGIVKAKCPVRCYEASKILWPDTPHDKLFPFIFFFDTEEGFRDWFGFLEDIDIKSNWDPRGYYRRIATHRFDKWGGPEGYLNYLRKQFAFKSLFPTVIYLNSDEAEIDNHLQVKENLYQPKFEDERELIMRAIKARRGQQKFRQNLRVTYGDKCMISGCKVIHIIESAHIIPYRSEDDNHVENGLLLRSDIHTLFDLDLLGIEPATLTIQISPILKQSEYAIYSGKKLICGNSIRPSQKALEYRWSMFQERNID